MARSILDTLLDNLADDYCAGVDYLTQEQCDFMADEFCSGHMGYYIPCPIDCDDMQHVEAQIEIYCDLIECTERF